ncbi:MAG: hypothetical protein M1415_09565 [Firmicutes bacterium]|nr:hypothetical protein [Bacillota bacterium]
MHKLEPYSTRGRAVGQSMHTIWWANGVPYEWQDPKTGPWPKTVLQFVRCVKTCTDADGDHQST